jgi:transcriptional regulator with XRE-family HTH domain
MAKLIKRHFGDDLQETEPTLKDRPLNPLDKHVGSRMRIRRMMLGISQEKLGKELGLTFQQVQKYEKGVNRLGASRLQQLSQILQVPVEFFFEGIPVPTANARRLTATANRLILTPDERSLQVDLVRLDRTVPVASCVAGRNSCTPASAQCAAAQIPEASFLQQR